MGIAQGGSCRASHFNLCGRGFLANADDGIVFGVFKVVGHDWRLGSKQAMLCISL